MRFGLTEVPLVRKTEALPVVFPKLDPESEHSEGAGKLQLCSELGMTTDGLPAPPGGDSLSAQSSRANRKNR